MVKSFFSRLLGLFRRRPEPPEPLPPLAPAPEWKPGNAEELRKFLQSEDGVALIALLRGLTTATALRAMHADPERLAWQCGYAAGVQGAVRYIDGLAQATPPETHAAPGVPTEDLEWLRGEGAGAGADSIQ